MKNNIYLMDEGTSQKYILPEKNVITIGRSNHCDIVFKSCFVSRKHCEIERIPPHGTLLLKSCTNTNPTYLDALKLLNKAVAELRVGSLIGLGIPLNIPDETRKKNKDYIVLKVCHGDFSTDSPEEINSLSDKASHTALTSSCQGEKSDHLDDCNIFTSSESKLTSRYKNASTCVPSLSTSPVSLSSKNVSNIDIQSIKSPNESLWQIPLQTELESLINSIKESHNELEKKKAIESKIVDVDDDSGSSINSKNESHHNELAKKVIESKVVDVDDDSRPSIKESYHNELEKVIESTIPNVEDNSRSSISSIKESHHSELEKKVIEGRIVELEDDSRSSISSIKESHHSELEKKVIEGRIVELEDDSRSSISSIKESHHSELEKKVIEGRIVELEDDSRSSISSIKESHHSELKKKVIESKIVDVDDDSRSSINSMKKSHHRACENKKAIESKMVDVEDSLIQENSASASYNSDRVSKCTPTVLPSEIHRSITEAGNHLFAHCIEELSNKSASHQLNHKRPLKTETTKSSQLVPTTLVQLSGSQTSSLPSTVSKQNLLESEIGLSLKTHVSIVNSPKYSFETFPKISSASENFNFFKEELPESIKIANTEESGGLSSIISNTIMLEEKESTSSLHKFSETSEVKGCYVKLHPLKSLPSLAHETQPGPSNLVQKSTLLPIHRKKKRLKNSKQSKLRIISSDSESEPDCPKNKRLKPQSISAFNDKSGLEQEKKIWQSCSKKAQEVYISKSIESEIKPFLDLTKIKIEKDCEPNDGDESDDDVIFYSQKTDEIILISSDEEETHSKPTNGDLLQDLSFGPLPFDEEELAPNDFEKCDVDFGLPDLRPPTNQHKESEHTLLVPPLESHNLDSSNQNKSDYLSDDDRWWPILSQEFEEDALNEECELVEKQSVSKSVKKDLQNIIDKIGSTTLIKSKLTEAKMPPVRKRGRPPKSAMLQTFLPDYKENKEKASVSSKKESSKKFRISKVKLNEDNKQHTHKCVSDIGKTSSKGLRNAILKTHNLEMYKGTTQKPKHHVGEPSYSTGQQLCENVQLPLNMSIQPKKKGLSGAEVKKGIAKISKKSRTQMLTEVDLFSSCIPAKTQRATSKFRIPKKSKTLHPQSSPSAEKVISPLTPIEIPVKKKSDKVVAIINEPEKQVNVNNLSNNKSLADNQNTNDQALKSILKRGPPNPPKNKVLFREDKLESTLLIPAREKQDSLISHNISHPKQKSDSTAAQNDGSCELFKFISKVCNWNCDWLTSYQQCKVKERFRPPPLTKKTLLPTLITYSSFEDYKNTFLCLMYYEVWEQIFKDWEKYVKTNMKFACEILSNTLTHHFSHKFSLVKAIGLIRNDLSLQGYHPAVGSLIIMSHKKDSKRGNTFGYIVNVIKPRDLHVSQHLRSICMPGANTPILFEILFSKPYVEYETQPQNVVEISNLSYIRSFVKGFESLGYLRHSKLFKTIIDPRDLNFFSFKNQRHEYLINQISLNQSQQNAVTYVSSQCFEAQNSPQISLIHGPPGTGKSRVITALVSQIILMFKRSEYASYRRILLCAPSNAAIDELVIKLIELKKINIDINIVRIGVKQKINPLIAEFSQDFLVNRQFQKELFPKDESFHKELEQKRFYSEKAVKAYKYAIKSNASTDIIQAKKQRMDNLLQFQTNFEESSKLKLSYTERNKMYTNCQKRILMKAEVIATTLTSCLSGPFFDFFSRSNSHFACCIIDEAGQSKETEIWFPLRLGINKLILVGDHQQLPATVLSQISQGKKLHQSLFERLYHHIGIERDRLDLIHSLNIQYRMHEAIAAWPAKHFYFNNLKTPASVTQKNSYALQPYIVFDVQSDESRLVEGEIFNHTEACFIQKLVEALEDHLVNLSIGILTPYQKQKMALLNKLDYFIKKYNITISTVDNFQGQEKDVIICSFVRANKSSKIGFVSDKQRLNVSLTRARKSCFLVGNMSSLQSSPDWISLVQDATERGVVQKITNEMLVDKNSLLRMALV